MAELAPLLFCGMSYSSAIELSGKNSGDLINLAKQFSKQNKTKLLRRQFKKTSLCPLLLLIISHPKCVFCLEMLVNYNGLCTQFRDK